MTSFGINTNRSMEHNREHRNRLTQMQLICDKVAKEILWIKENHFNKWGGIHWIFICKNMSFDSYLVPYVKLKMNLRPKYKT